LLRGRKRWIEAASPLLHEAAIESPASRGSAFLAMADPYIAGKEPKQQMKAAIEMEASIPSASTSLASPL
jgi:hypothetical protein